MIALGDRQRKRPCVGEVSEQQQRVVPCGHRRANQVWAGTGDSDMGDKMLAKGGKR
jgi:hypothetical protein